MGSFSSPYVCKRSRVHTYSLNLADILSYMSVIQKTLCKKGED